MMFRIWNRSFPLLAAGGLLVGCTAPVKHAAVGSPTEWSSTEARAAYAEAMECLSEGRQASAESVVQAACAGSADAPQLFFLRGVLELSREKQEAAYGSFAETYRLDRASVPGQAAEIMVPMDMGTAVEEGFAALAELIEDDPDELLLRWLYAMESARHGLHGREALEQCNVLMERWPIAPATLHGLYATLLTNEEADAEQALEHRMLAAEMEPGVETYRGLAYTLARAGRYADADLAYAKLIEMDGSNPGDWFRWGNALAYQGDYASAAEKFEQACLLNDTEAIGRLCQGRCLEHLGHPEAGYERYIQALRAHPNDQQAAAYVAHAKLFGYGTAPDFEGAVALSARQGKPAIDVLRERVLLANESDNPLAPERSDVLIEHLTALGDEGNASAQYSLGMIYRHGIGVPRDAGVSVLWLERAAENGHGIAQRMLHPPL